LEKKGAAACRETKKKKTVETPNHVGEKTEKMMVSYNEGRRGEPKTRPGGGEKGLEGGGERKVLGGKKKTPLKKKRKGV